MRKTTAIYATVSMVVCAPALAAQAAPGSDQTVSKKSQKRTAKPPKASLAATPASSQDIIITAEKTSSSAQHTPVSVTVIGEQQLHQMGAQSFQDYAAS